MKSDTMATVEKEPGGTVPAYACHSSGVVTRTFQRTVPVI